MPAQYQKSFVPQIVVPRIEGSVDEGHKKRVLARLGTKELRWCCAGVQYVDRVTLSVPVKSALRLVDTGDRDRMFNSPRGRTLIEGGRLSRALLLRFSGQINSYFNGVPIADMLVESKRLKETMIVTR